MDKASKLTLVLGKEPQPQSDELKTGQYHSQLTVSNMDHKYSKQMAAQRSMGFGPAL